MLENVNIYLKDNLLNSMHDLHQSDYEFQVTEIGVFNNRFELIFNRNALSINENSTNDNLVIFNQSETEIGVKMLNTSIIKSLIAYDILGKEILNLKPNKSDFIMDTNIKQGTILFIKVALENGQILNTKFIKK